jgi:hypothetical protein
MKKIIIVLLILLIAQTAKAQLFSKERILNRANIDKKTLSWGYYIGFNNYDYYFDYKEQNQGDNTDILVTGETGFNVGLLGNLRISNYFDLRLEPGLSFTKRNLVFPGFTDPKDNLREVKATYIHIPLLLKVSTKRLNNIKPFLIGGFPDLLIWQVTKITLRITLQEHSDLPAVILVMNWDLESIFIFIILNLLHQFGVFLGLMIN